jgi:hypothetical protein
MLIDELMMVFGFHRIDAFARTLNNESLKKLLFFARIV